MSKKDGGPVYPVTHVIDQYGNPNEEGMTLRQYYKAAALTGILGNSSLENYWQAIEHIGARDTDDYIAGIKEACSKFADVMIAEDEEAKDNG